MVHEFFCLTYLSWHDILKMHPCCCKWQCFIFFLMAHSLKTFVHRTYAPPCLCSITHGGQNKETTAVAFNRWLDKEAVVCIYNVILLDDHIYHEDGGRGQWAQDDGWLPGAGKGKEIDFPWSFLLERNIALPTPWF